MTEHKLKLTPGHVRNNEVEPPWVCENCGKHFMRHTNAKTCKGGKGKEQ